MKKKGLTLLVAVTMLACAAIGGTLAWLTDSTDEVTNVFTTANIGVTLEETKKPDGTENTGGAAVTDWTAQMVPGYEYKKDPTVTVEANSVDCYLFVKFEETNNTFGADNAKIIQFTSNLTAANSGWTQGLGESVITGEGAGLPTNVWFRTVTSSANNQSWHLIANDKVTINKDLTKEVMNAQGYTAPQLTYTAYATQLHKTNVGENADFTPAEAWDKVKPAESGSSTGGQITTGGETDGDEGGGGIGGE